MKLFGSLLTTGLIVASVWFIASLQIATASNPAAASEQAAPKKEANQLHASTKTNTAEPDTQKPTKKHNKSSLLALNIAGVSEHISLSSATKLWQRFEQKTLLHAKLTKQPSKIYVYYRNFGQNYQSADVTIGYNAEIINPVAGSTAKLNGQYQRLLQKGSYNTAELTTAWEKIDYRQKIHSVVEIHYLDNNSQPTSTEVLVKYL